MSKRTPADVMAEIQRVAAEHTRPLLSPSPTTIFVLPEGGVLIGLDPSLSPDELRAATAATISAIEEVAGDLWSLPKESFIVVRVTVEPRGEKP